MRRLGYKFKSDEDTPEAIRAGQLALAGAFSAMALRMKREGG